MHILVLTDRDWTHPQGGGTGANLFGQVSRWLAWGHRVSVIACSYPGAESFERIEGREGVGDLEIHRMGGRSTLFPRAIWKQWRGLVPDADVVLEVINGITFLTPLWLRRPRVALIHHVHREHFVEEMGRKGGLAAFLLETAPLRWLYRGSRFLTISHATARQIAEHGIPLDRIEVSYLGVELEAFEPGERAPEPTLLYLGRLKRYKRIEVVLDVLEAIPEATLDVAGDGDHREALEAEIARRGLAERVRMHGHVDEDEKRRLLRRSWVNLTASSAEGWCLTVMEAGASGTPSAALGVGGLPESIEDGRTGFLARDPADLAAKTGRIVADPQLRERLGGAALDRAREFTWDRTARQSLELLQAERERQAGAPSFFRQLLRSDTGRAAGLAGAQLTANVVALVFTVVFARILGAGDYGSLVALLSTFIILQVPGNAMQVAVAREVASAIADGHANPGAEVRIWLRRLVVGTIAVTGAALVLRDPLAAAIGVDEVPWAAAATVPTGALWLLLAVIRGALQGVQRYRLVGGSIVAEAAGRLAAGLVLVAVGLDVTGAFLGTTFSLMAVAAVLTVPLLRRFPRPEREDERGISLTQLLRGALVPVMALALIAVVQEVHVIVVKHEVDGDAAGAYGAAAVAAKAIVWVGVGLGLYLVPEAARRTRLGDDARPILVRTLALIALGALPMVLVYAVAGAPLLRTVFGEKFTSASDALPLLGLAMSLLACVFLTVQYLLALRRSKFVVVLAVAAVLEPLLLLTVGGGLTDFALTLLAVQLVLASVVLAIGLQDAARAQARAGTAPA
jgi:glycosyltransferase involved in cell wall biosynthesis/O-antigen/teichoic acid export membrane protein